MQLKAREYAIRGITYPKKEDEKKYYDSIITFEPRVCKLGKDLFFSSNREKRESVQETALLKVADCSRMQWYRNTALKIDFGILVIVAGKENFYIIYILKPCLGDSIGSLLVQCLGTGDKGG